MAASALGLSIVGILALIIASAAKVDTTQGIWLTVAVLPAVGLILGSLFLVAFLIVFGMRRARAAKDASN